MHIRSTNSAPRLCETSHERRSAARIETPFPATVRGVNIDDQPFEEHTVLDNFSSSGLYLRLARRVLPGVRLFVLMRLSVAPNATYIALRGVVLRTEPRPGGIFGTALRFTHHRFIYPTYLVTYGSLAGHDARRDISDRW
jgi:hypothetical protein